MDIKLHGFDFAILGDRALKGEFSVVDTTSLLEELDLAPGDAGVGSGGGEVVAGSGFELGEDGGVAADALAGGVIRETDADGESLHERLKALDGGKTL